VWKTNMPATWLLQTGWKWQRPPGNSSEQHRELQEHHLEQVLWAEPTAKVHTIGKGEET